MTIWKNSKMRLFFDNRVDLTDPSSLLLDCKVELNDKEIIVKYDLDGEFYQYKGKADDEDNFANGHFVVYMDEPKNYGSLHMFIDSSILEGSWKVYDDDGAENRGMWRIELKD